MAPQTTEIDRAVFLTHLQYVHCAEAVRKAGINSKAVIKIKERASELEVQHAKASLPLPTIQELVARKERSRAKPKILDNKVLHLLEACTLNKKQRKKLWHVVAHEEGFFNVYCCTIKKKLHEQSL